MPSRKKINFSIFIKLIILIIIFIVLVNFSIGFILRFGIDRPPPPPFPFRPSNKLPMMFNQYFIKDVGDPPDTVRAREVLKELGTGVRFETSKSGWSTSPDIPGISELKKEKDFEENENRFTIRKKGRIYEIIKTENGYVIFAPPFPREQVNIESGIAMLIGFMTIVAALLYFSLRWIFGPIKKLSTAVGQISQGNFDAPLDVRRNDELGNLAQSINEMKTNISVMIKAKESLLIDVSHELRSPLTRIKLASEFIEDEKIRNRLRDDIREMEALITELLDTYRLESASGKLNLEKVDLVKFIEVVVSKFGHAQLNFRSEFKKREISIDKEKIEIVLNNIIDNAIKYSDNKSVEVTLMKSDASKNETVISIRDHGRGIPEEEHIKIFEPFYRIDKSRDKKISGYGLGLSIVKKILRLHNARIEINSQPSDGSDFRITLTDADTSA